MTHPTVDALRATCVVGLGSNIGDRRQILASAVARFGEFASITAVSPLFESEPVGGPSQPWFLNAAVGLSEVGDPLGLLRRLHRLEREAGRVRDEHWGPRTLDLDILWAAEPFRHPRLQIPHPRLEERRFALLSLLAVAPHASDPVTGERYAERPLSATLGAVRRIAENGWWRATPSAPLQVG